MFTESQREQFGQVARTSQIIALALMSGVFMFAAVVLGAGLGPEEPAETPIISIVAAVATFTSAFLAPLVPRLLAGNVRRTLIRGEPLPQFSTEVLAELGEAGALAGTYQIGQILYRAILEGAALLNLAAFMVEGHSFNLALAVFVLIGMALKFPTRDHLENWVGDQLKTIEQMRGLGG